MLDRIATDLWSNVEAVFLSLSSDYVAGGIALVILIIAGLFMRGYGQIINTTFGALVVYGIALVLWSAFGSGADVSAETAIGNSWDAFMAVTMGAFLVYFIAFFLVITIIYIIRSAFSR
ncbi:MAG: hypothetical protein ACOC91_02590 [bacterium]